MKKLIDLIKGEDGVTSSEYALIAALIFLVIIGAVTLMGQAVEGTFSNVASQMP
jgi:pilus assembly protein Flp/PilA